MTSCNHRNRKILPAPRPPKSCSITSDSSLKQIPFPVQADTIDFHHRAPGHSTKFWLFPDGRCYDTEGLLHFRWAQTHCGFLHEHYRIVLDLRERNTDDEQAVRLTLIRQGMIRMNHCVIKNRLTIEGCAPAFTNTALDFLRRFILSNPESITSARLNRFDAAATTYTSSAVHFPLHLTPTERGRGFSELITFPNNRLVESVHPASHPPKPPASDIQTAARIKG